MGGMDFLVGFLLLLLIDIDGRLIGGQFISLLGDKWLLFNMVFKGIFIVVYLLEVGDNLELVVIIEGYVMVLMLDMLIDGLVVVVVVVNNLLNVV